MTRLHSDHMRPSSQRLGRQDGGLIPCQRSKHHPHYPSMEECPLCEPVADDMETADTLPPPDWSDWNAFTVCRTCSYYKAVCVCPTTGGTP